MRDTTVTSHDGIALAVRDHGGNGPEVLLLHGATRNLEDWGAVLRHLRGLRVVAMDQRFHGLSGIAAPTKPSDWVRDIETVVETVGLSEPLVVGHSMGGVNALLYGAEHPKCRGVLDIDGYDIRQPEFYDELPPERVREYLDGFAAQSEPLVVGHSMGGVNALLYGAEHPECRGVLDIDGYDIRQPEFYDELRPERVREYLDGFAAQSESFDPQGDEGDDDWHGQQVAMAKQMDEAWAVDTEVTQAVVGRAFVRTAEGRWERRPPSSFWGVAIADGMTVDTLGLLRRTSCPVTVLLCTKPVPMPMGPAAEFFAVRRRGLERHLGAIAAERPNVSIETIEATHGVIHERPLEIAELIMSLATS